MRDAPPSCRLPRSRTVFLLGASRVGRNTCAVWGKSWGGEPAPRRTFCDGTQRRKHVLVKRVSLFNSSALGCTRHLVFCVLLCRLFVRFPAPLLAQPPPRRRWSWYRPRLLLIPSLPTALNWSSAAWTPGIWRREIAWTASIKRGARKNTNNNKSCDVGQIIFMLGSTTLQMVFFYMIFGAKNK